MKVKIKKFAFAVLVLAVVASFGMLGYTFQVCVNTLDITKEARAQQAVEETEVRELLESGYTFVVNGNLVTRVPSTLDQYDLTINDTEKVVYANLRPTR